MAWVVPAGRSPDGLRFDKTGGAVSPVGGSLEPDRTMAVTE